MLIRTYYLERMEPFIGKPVVKAITGLRRVGKSVLVRQMMEHLKRQGVSEKNIVYADIESLDFDFIRDYRALNDYIRQQTEGVEGKIHVFVDEIQDILEWERAVAMTGFIREKWRSGRLTSLRKKTRNRTIIK